MALNEVKGSIAPTGKLRVAINFGNVVLAQRDPVTSEPKGVSVDLARIVSDRLDLPVEFNYFDSAGKVFDAVAQAKIDVCFLAIDPLRATEIAFTPPYVNIEGTYIVRQGSSYHSVQDLDANGVRIAVGGGAAYDLFLSRALKSATLVRSTTSASAIAAFAEQQLDAAAGVRQPLQTFSQSHAGFRVLSDSFTTIHQAMGVPTGRGAAHLYLTEFIEEMKRTGFVRKSLDDSGQTDAAVASAAT
ncbi:ABC transporter substrate-binding protein [Paraburkholderia sediminicola]|uniref:ABC transporter substrate-binding protein n=1 Tax=Paraburkholderia sediminicola TaxID=458836 RepID=UPI0038BB56DE